MAKISSNGAKEVARIVTPRFIWVMNSKGVVLRRLRVEGATYHEIMESVPSGTQRARKFEPTKEALEGFVGQLREVAT